MEHETDETTDTALLKKEGDQASCHSKNRILTSVTVIIVLCVVGIAVTAVVTVLTNTKAHPKSSPQLHEEPTFKLPRANVPGLGALQGYYSKLTGASKVSVFMGIPYAKPPTEDRRWRKPEPFGKPLLR